MNIQPPEHKEYITITCSNGADHFMGSFALDSRLFDMVADQEESP